MSRSFLIALALLGLLAVFAAPVVHGEEVDAGNPTEPVTEESHYHDTFSSEERQAIAAKEEKHEFQAEVTRLMDIIINSLYSKREIFVRELISNAADALDKVRYLSLTNQTTLGEGDQAKLEIRISFDKEKKTLSIFDRGVGMTKAELIKNLGVVARSGTTEFVEAATKNQDSEALSLIGQFGVGFYSVYLVADRVTVVSKADGDVQHVWESTADKTFTIAEDPRGNTLGRGTLIQLHLKEDAASDFTNEHELRKLVARYSEFINYPIYLQVHKSIDKEVPDEDAATEEPKKEDEPKPEGEEEKKEGEDIDVEVKDDDEEAEKKPKMKKIQETVTEWERLNDVKAIWTRSPKDITEEEYEAFYKTLTKDESGHLTTSISLLKVKLPSVRSYTCQRKLQLNCMTNSMRSQLP